MTKKQFLVLFLVSFLGAILRTFNINWDNFYHLHPDERAIVMFVEKLSLPQSFSQFFSPKSPLNPNFFAYGSFPLYLLEIVAYFVGIFNHLATTYDYINLVGRFISAFFDTMTILVIFKIGNIFLKKKYAILTAFFYSVCVLPIQLSHFYAVDTILTFFMTFALYQLLIFYSKPKTSKAIQIGVITGFAIATKITGAFLFLPIFVTYFLQYFTKIKLHPLKLPKNKNLITPIIFFITTIILSYMFFIILEPYALIDFQNFYSQTTLQLSMSKSAFVFPYTLQYVGKIPYIYELSQIFLWGLGPILSIISFLGIIVIIYNLFFKEQKNRLQFSILIIYFFGYFILIGSSAVKYMRYSLPLYPLFCFFAAYFIYFLSKKIPNKKVLYTINAILIFFIILWTASFMHIYTKPNTRVVASEWIHSHIPAGSAIADEYWDDFLPLAGSENYNIIPLNLYPPDTTQKWQLIDQQLKTTDYIILASNRVYVPLQKLTNCKKLPVDKCYPLTAQYYKELFSGKLGFKKVAQFSEYPTIPFTNIKINDEKADEEFTVFDHPKVMIFKKIKP